MAAGEDTLETIVSLFYHPRKKTIENLTHDFEQETSFQFKSESSRKLHILITNDESPDPAEVEFLLEQIPDNVDIDVLMTVVVIKGWVSVLQPFYETGKLNNYHKYVALAAEFSPNPREVCTELTRLTGTTILEMVTSLLEEGKIKKIGSIIAKDILTSQDCQTLMVNISMLTQCRANQTSSVETSESESQTN
jgi:hypothetical protein